MEEKENMKKFELKRVEISTFIEQQRSITYRYFVFIKRKKFHIKYGLVIIVWASLQ